mmetsp:Transcript_62328/g.140973  ORF Transcript_62328/g.140973 Transcript_62328/m.140973 type:complete len:292 (+) Transcript_62328:478-1353(+)
MSTCLSSGHAPSSSGRRVSSLCATLRVSSLGSHGRLPRCSSLLFERSRRRRAFSRGQGACSAAWAPRWLKARARSTSCLRSNRAGGSSLMALWPRLSSTRLRASGVKASSFGGPGSVPWSRLEPSRRGTKSAASSLFRSSTRRVSGQPRSSRGRAGPRSSREARLASWGGGLAGAPSRFPGASSTRSFPQPPTTCASRHERWLPVRSISCTAGAASAHQFGHSLSPWPARLRVREATAAATASLACRARSEAWEGVSCVSSASFSMRRAASLRAASASSCWPSLSSCVAWS